MNLQTTENQKPEPFRLKSRLIAIKIIKEHLEALEKTQSSNRYLDDYLLPLIGDLKARVTSIQGEIDEALESRLISADDIIYISAF